MSLTKSFARQPARWIMAEMVGITLFTGVLDYITGYRIRVLPFYSMPIFIAAWFCGRKSGLIMAALCGIVWWSANWLTGDPDLHIESWIRVWETFRHIGFFMVVALTGAALRAKSDIAAARIALLEHTQRLEREIVTITDAEQRRIGQDLHDGLCQYLAALSVAATSLRDDLEKLDLQIQSARAAELAVGLRDAIVQTRDLARGLVPAHVSDVGLADALDALTQSVARLQGVNCSFRFHGPMIECDERTAMHLYRIAQEAIHNASKHGQAKNIVLSLELTGDLLTLKIFDDGIGMTATRSSGMGLRAMRYRARLNGGDLSIDQPESGGTIVSCTARLNHLEQSENVAA